MWISCPFRWLPKALGSFGDGKVLVQQLKIRVRIQFYFVFQFVSLAQDQHPRIPLLRVVLTNAQSCEIISDVKNWITPVFNVIPFSLFSKFYYSFYKLGFSEWKGLEKVVRMLNFLIFETPWWITLHLKIFIVMKSLLKWDLWTYLEMVKSLIKTLRRFWKKKWSETHWSNFLTSLTVSAESAHNVHHPQVPFVQQRGLARTWRRARSLSRQWLLLELTLKQGVSNPWHPVKRIHHNLFHFNLFLMKIESNWNRLSSVPWLGVIGLRPVVIRDFYSVPLIVWPAKRYKACQNHEWRCNSWKVSIPQHSPQ